MKSNTIRRAAKGEACTLQLVGICNHDPETSVLAHLPDESHGMARKSDDISAIFACSNCHAAIDGRAFMREYNASYTPEEKQWVMRRALVRTWRRLISRGIIQLPKDTSHIHD